MKKNLLEKKVINRIIILLIAIMLVNIMVPKPVQADGWSSGISGTIASNISDFLGFLGDTLMSAINWCLSGEWHDSVDSEAGEVADGTDETRWRDNGGKIDLPDMPITPDSILEGKVAVLGINFIEPIATQDEDGNLIATDERLEVGSENQKTLSGLEHLRNIIAKWYIALRNLALVGMLSVLVYTGIRIIISSTSQDKAKYKERLMDWIMGICLVLILHYIMLAAIKINDKIVNMLTPETSQIKMMEGDKIQTNGYWTIDEVGEYLETYGLKCYKDAVISTDLLHIYQDDKQIGKLSSGWTEKIEWTKDSDNYIMEWNGDIVGFRITKFRLVSFTINGEPVENIPTKEGIEYTPSNLVEYARVYCELNPGAEMFAFLIIYIILVIYTIMFALRYMKRTIYIAFLTLMAPLVSLTYALDKMNDGKSQAFDMWLKEFIFNVLIQPFQLLIYMILVGASLQLATTNMIYALVAIGFIMPAEKLLRKFFGFDSKASTLSAAGSFAGGAAVASLFNAIKKPPKLLGGNNGGKETGKQGENSENGIRYYNSETGSALDELAGGDNIREVESPEQSGQLEQAKQDRLNVAGLSTIQASRNLSQERLKELTAQGYSENDPEYTKVRDEISKYDELLGNKENKETTPITSNIASKPAQVTSGRKVGDKNKETIPISNPMQVDSGRKTSIKPDTRVRSVRNASEGKREIKRPSRKDGILAGGVYLGHQLFGKRKNRKKASKRNFKSRTRSNRSRCRCNGWNCSRSSIRRSFQSIAIWNGRTRSRSICRS